jgi:hypothetical protein
MLRGTARGRAADAAKSLLLATAWLTWTTAADAQPGPPDETYIPPDPVIAVDCDDAELERYARAGQEGELSEACRERLRVWSRAFKKQRLEQRREQLPEWRHWDPDSLEAYSLGLFGGGMEGYFDELELGTLPGIELPDVLSGRRPRLDGRGWFAGAGARATAQGDSGVRVGVAIGAYYLGGAELVTDALAPGVEVSVERGSMLGSQLYFGKAFDARVLFPYVDAMLLFNVVNVEADVSIAGFGHVGSTTLSAFSFGLAPRLGVFIPFDGDFYLDVAAHYGMFGVEQGGGQIMFGTWSD